MPFGYVKLKMTRPKKVIPPQIKRVVPPRRKREVKKSEQKVSADLDEEQIVVAPSSIFDVYQYLEYENDKKQPLFYRAFTVK